ncbi:MAG: vWA domain-containing protein [Nocardioides sp.]
MDQRVGAMTWMRAAWTLPAAAALALTPVAPAAADDDKLAIAAGGSMSISQRVETPFVPAVPDIVLVVDRTGSMAPAITDVKSKIAHVIATIRAGEPNARFGVVAYCDTGEATPPVSVISPLSSDAATVIDRVIAMPLCYGGDLPEAQFAALEGVGSGLMNFRPSASRVIAWFGDAPGNGRLASESAATAALNRSKARVVAVSVGRDQLNAGGQARRIVRATGGSLLSGVPPGGVASSLLTGLTSLPVEVSARAKCDDGLRVNLKDRAIEVASGKAATFEETVVVATDAEPGATLTCSVSFRIDGRDLGPRYVQDISVTVRPANSPSPDPSPTESVSQLPTQPPTQSPTQSPSKSPGDPGSPSSPSSPSGSASADSPPAESQVVPPEQRVP